MGEFESQAIVVTGEVIVVVPQLEVFDQLGKIVGWTPGAVGQFANR